jgi:Protein kinase domain
LTASGQIVGTPSYMAPEQASGKKEVGPAADVYALGAILYELLTGRPPFRAATPLDTVMQVIAEEPVPPSQVQPKVPRDLETLCLKCLEKRPERRYASAQALADELGRFLNYEPIHARPASRARRVGVWVRKRPWVVVVYALLSVLAVTLFAQALYLENQQQNLDNLYREAQIARLSLAQQPAPVAGAPLRPAAEHALAKLRQAAAVRPERRLYEEALNVLLVEHRGGRRIYPRPDGKAVLQRAWIERDAEFPRPFALSRDGAALLLPDLVYRIDTGTTGPPDGVPAGARPAGPEFSADGRFIARMPDRKVSRGVIIAGSKIEVYAVGVKEPIRRISVHGVGTVALSPDGASLAWSIPYGVNRKVQIVRVADAEPIRELSTTGPGVGIVRLAYTWDGQFVVGQTGYGYSIGERPDYQEHDHICLWDAADGTLVAWLPGRAFADGFGPHGELAVARAVNSTTDADPEIEIDLWRPAELVAALQHGGLTGWPEFASAASRRDTGHPWQI